MSILIVIIMLSPIYLLWLTLFPKVGKKEKYVIMVILIMMSFGSEYNGKTNFEYYIIEGNNWSTLNE